MYRHTVRSAPRAASALRQTTLRSTPRRFASTAPADKPRTWKGSALRWGLAGAAVYYYNTSPVFADEPAPRTIPAPSDFAASDLKTVDAVIEEKRQKTIVKPKEAAPAATPAAPIPSSETASEQLTAAPGSPEALEQEAGQQGAFNPETGEINWDCPCLGGMADGPCGEDFKTAFSCFVYSNEDPKGIDCIEKFQGMQDCFKKYPEIYDPELSDDREDEPVADGNAGAEHEPEVASQNQTTETIAAKVNDAVEKTTEKAAEVIEKTKVKVADVKEKVIEKATEAKDKVSTKSKPTRIQSTDDTDPKQADEAIKADIKPAFSDATAANDEQFRYTQLVKMSGSESWADVASKGPQQTAEEARAPPPVEVQTDAETSTSSLVDVDSESVRTVPSDYLQQEVQTETQADRIDREEKARAEAELAKKKAAHKARRADSWLTRQFSSLSDGSAGALAIVNLVGVVGLSGFLGYRAWGLYERGRLSWQNVGVGLGVLGVVGVVEGIFGGYLYKTKGKK
ncbi:hypothetical protein ACHAQF_006280 [Verticillium nonalfalfae]